jgi:hypothetical protein
MLRLTHAVLVSTSAILISGSALAAGQHPVKTAVAVLSLVKSAALLVFLS